MAVKQIEWKPEVNREAGKWWLRAFISGVLCALLVFGCFSLALTVLGMREVEGEFKFRFFVWAGSMGFCFLREWTEYEEDINKSKIRNILPAIGLLIGQLIIIWFLYNTGGDIWPDLQTVGETYLHRMSIQDPDYRLSRAETNAMKPAIEFTILVLFVFFQSFSGALRKQKVLLAMPVCVVCAGLLTMAVPKWKDLALVFLSGMLLVYVENCVRISWKRFGILLAGLLILVSVAGRYEADAQDEMLAMNEDWFAYWNDFGETIGEKLENMEMPQFNADKDVIDNKPPKFSEKPVLTITMEEKPQGTLYLRGYHCADYEGGEWIKDLGSFSKACKEYGIEEEDAIEKLLENQYEREKEAGSKLLDFEISFTKYCDEYTYLPYGVAWNELPEGYELSGDYVVTGKHTEELNVTGWQRLSYLEVRMEAPQDYSRFKDWYNDYVYENYLEVSGELDAVEDLAEKLREDAVLSSYLAYVTVENHTPDTINYYRLQLAQSVAQYLRREGTYSLELDKLPSGEDAVEYFLENDMEGFCEHFASAGTLLLRELGVPARYVGGYIVKQSDMEKEDDGYEATVMDSAAHAWTEIYLENYGWVPIEMTPGYGGTDSIAEPETTPEPEDAEPTEEPTTAPDEEPTATPDEDVLSPEEPTEAPGQDAGTSEEEMEDGKNGDSEDADDLDDSWKNSGRDGSILGKVLAGFFLVVIVTGGVGGISRYLREREARGMKRLLGYMRSGENRNAIRWINKLMYERLVEKEEKRNKYSDVEYLGSLKCLYPEIEEARWDSYFEVVRKAVYSREKITPEDVKVCYEVYKAVMETDANS